MGVIAYKLLLTDAVGPYSGFQWPRPKGSKPGKWVTASGALVRCRTGIHACTREQILRWVAEELWEIELDGEILRYADKLIARKGRLLRHVEAWDARTARLFACDCAERALQTQRKAGREPDPRAWEAVRVARRYANDRATVDELTAAWAAAWDAASAAATWAAAGDADWDADWDAAWAAAGAAAGAAARAAAWAAAWAADWATDWAAAGAAAGAKSAARDAETQWQTKRLWEYLEGKRGRHG